MTTNLVRTQGHRSVRATFGVAYAVCWLVGLTIASASTTVRSTGAQVVAQVSGDSAHVAAQYLLTEGGAGICLAVVAALLGGWVAVTGVTAGLVAVGQSVLGLLLVHAADRGDAHLAGTLFDVVNRADGWKMLVLAAMTAVGTRLAGPRWLPVTGWVATGALVLSALGYVLLNSTLAYAAYLSLPLLILWVTGMAIGAEA